MTKRDLYVEFLQPGFVEIKQKRNTRNFRNSIRKINLTKKNKSYINAHISTHLMLKKGKNNKPLNNNC